MYILEISFVSIKIAAQGTIRSYPIFRCAFDDVVESIYHKTHHLGCCSSPRSASVYCIDGSPSIPASSA